MAATTWSDVKAYLERLKPWRLLEQIDALALRTEQWMTATADAITRLNTVTNDLATRIRAIQDSIAATDAENAAQLGTIANTLDALGRDPADPVPADLPTETEPPL